MATMTVSLPDAMKDWIESQIESGEFATSSDYVRDLVRRDRVQRSRDRELSTLRQRVAESLASGVSSCSVEDIFAEAEKIAHSRGTWRE